MRFFALFALAIALPLPVLAQHRQTFHPARVLTWVIEAQPRIKVSGTRVVEMIVKGEWVRIVEFVWRDGLNARTTYPENSFRQGFIVVENKEERLEYDPHRNEIRRSKADRGGPLFILNRVRDAFQRGELRVFIFEGAEVAGRPTIGITVADGHGNVAQRFWVDAEYALVLKAVQYGRGGEERGRVEFTKVNFSPTFPEGAWQINRAGARVVDESEPGTLPWKPLEPTWLPQGFYETNRGVRHLDGRTLYMIHCTDGKRHISIFQSQARRDDTLPPKIPGQGHNIISGRIGHVWVAVVGDVDVQVLERVLKSLV